jgi:hypothetical protein
MKNEYTQAPAGNVKDFFMNMQRDVVGADYLFKESYYDDDKDV